MRIIFLVFSIATSVVFADYFGGGNATRLQGYAVSASAPSNNQCLVSDGTTWSPGSCSTGAGDVAGPGSATDNGFCRFDGTTGKLIQNTGTGSSLSDAGVGTFTGLVSPTHNSAASLALEALGVGGAVSLTAGTASLYVSQANGTEVFGAPGLTIWDGDLHFQNNKGLGSSGASDNPAYLYLENLTASRALASDANNKVVSSATTATELGYVNGVTSAIQTQLNAKQSTSLTSAHILVGNGSNVATDVAVSGDLTLANTGAFTLNTVAVNKGGTGVTSVTTAPAASAWAGWDANSNLSANSCIQGYATTATAAGTTTLVVGSAAQQYFTGSTTQTVKLPVTSTLVTGQSFLIVNLSSGVVTLQSSGANTLQAMAANTQLIATVISTSGTGTASWNWSYSSIQNSLAGGVTTMAAVGSTPNANSASISGSTLTLQPADATNPGVVTAGTQTFGGTKTFANIVDSGLTASQVVATDASKNLVSLAYSNAGVANQLVQADSSGNINASAYLTSVRATIGNFGLNVTTNSLTSSSFPWYIGPGNGTYTLNINSGYAGVGQHLSEDIDGNTLNIGYGYLSKISSFNYGFFKTLGLGYAQGDSVPTKVIGQIIVKTGTNLKLTADATSINGHVKSQGTAPTTTPNANLGTGGTCAVSHATDTTGQVALTGGTVSLSSGAQCAVNFNTAYAVAPICIMWPADSNAAANIAVIGQYVTSSTSAMTLNFAVAATALTTYTWNYSCIEPGS